MNIKKRAIALVLCLATLFSVVSLGNIIAVSTDASESGTEREFVNYGALVGRTARFNIESFMSFAVTADPKLFNDDFIEGDWENEDNIIYYDDVEGVFDFSADLELVIIDYFWNSDSTSGLWLKIKAAPGHELPEKLSVSPWVFQNHTDEYEYEDWQDYAPDALILGDSKNYILDENGNVVTSISIGAYDKVKLFAKSSLIGSVEYKWQILVGDLWTDIMDRKSDEIVIDYSLVMNALDADEFAKVRCVAVSGSDEIVGDPITVMFTSTESLSLELEDVTRTYLAPPAVPLAAGTDVCRITIQYLFENGTLAENSYVAEVPYNAQSTINVTFPIVQGYLPHYQGVQQNEISITKVFTEHELYTVYYEPTEVKYTVDIYFQNVDNDNYTFYDSRTLYGMTGSNVPLKTQQFEGMHELLHETPPIAADGTTSIKVYYDRNYYMTRVYLMGGFGIYSVYARYGSNLQSHLTAPTRPGYIFVGWDQYTVDSDADDVPDTGDDKVVDTVEPTVPSRNLAYVALWKESPTSSVSIVFWGRNADDEGFSYLETQNKNIAPGEELKYTLSGGYICGLENHTHNNTCVLNCTLPAHTHTLADGCYKLSCSKTDHYHDQLGCSLNCGHHTRSCYSVSYGGSLTETNKPTQTLTSQGNGIYTYRSGGWTYYYVNVGDKWYAAQWGEISLNCGHNSHNDSCYNCGEKNGSHTHSIANGCYTVICSEHVHGLACYDCVEHTHSNELCGYGTFVGYDSNLWTLTTDPEYIEEITVQRESSDNNEKVQNILNVYFERTEFTLTFKATGNNGRTLATLKRKWGTDIRAEFQEICNENTFLWSRTSNGDSPWTSFLDVMPKENRTYYAKTVTSSNTQTATYYGADLNGDYTIVLFTSNVKYGSNLTVSEEEFVEIEGYTFNAAKSTKTGSSFNGAKFYYDRSSNILEFHYGNESDEVRKEPVIYQMPLSNFNDYIPPLPDEYEAESHEFVEWYLDPALTVKADLNQLVMPDSNLALYAKWKPVYHDVYLVLEKNPDGIYTEEDSLLWVGADKVLCKSVLHGTLVFDGLEDKTPSNPDNGEYKFLGWFYTDPKGNELMWDFEHHPVVRDTVIYAKWSGEVLVPYTIYYKDEHGNEIAPPTTSSSLAGYDITVNAKVGNELYEGYRSGYFPITTSTSIDLDIEKADIGVTYTFVYKKQPEIKYWVHYVDAENGNAELSGSPEEYTTTFAIETETFKFYDGYVPDEYQKSLILSSDESQNHLYFYYTKSKEKGVWFIGHYVQEIDSENPNDPEEYLTHSTAGDVELLKTEISATRPTDLNEDGFTFAYATINDGNTTKTVYSMDAAKGQVTAKGLEIKVYYTRNKYPYKVVYRNKDTGVDLGSVIYDGSTGKPMEHYGKTVHAPSSLPTFDGYEFASAGTTTIVKDDVNNITKNIIYVYYTEQSIRLNFNVVGDDGCGTLNAYYTYVKINSDNSTSVTATPSERYRFEGWYYDEACQLLITKDPMLVLMKPAGGWAPAEYYAKFEPNVGDLTIVRENGDSDQVYVYEVKNNENGEIITVTVKGNSSVTIKDLTVGNYTVTQQNSWSWRHDDFTKPVEHMSVGGTTVTFDKKTGTQKWLNGNSELYVNKFGG